MSEERHSLIDFPRPGVKGRRIMAIMTDRVFAGLTIDVALEHGADK